VRTHQGENLARTASNVETLERRVSTAIDRVVAIANAKGGAGKTSIAANVGGVAAASDYRVLLCDLDPQGNLERDLGYRTRSDKGESLVDALRTGKADRVTVLRGVRENLDVIAGGVQLEDWQAIANSPGRITSAATALTSLLASVANRYDLILLDCPPGNRLLQQQALTAARFVVIPSKTDAASIDGVEGVATVFDLVEPLNPDVEALGVVLFGISSNASAVRRKAETDVNRTFGTPDVLFHTAIRHSEKVAQDCRERGQLVIEYEADLEGQLGYWAARKAGKEVQRLSAASRGLAEDYIRLTEEVVARRAAALTNGLAAMAR